MGLVHRPRLGWRVFASLGGDVPTVENIEGMLVEPTDASLWPIERATSALLALMGRREDIVGARNALRHCASAAQRPTTTTLSESYVDWVMSELRDEERKIVVRAEAEPRMRVLKERFHTEVQQYAKLKPYHPWSEADVERVVKQYLLYLATPRRFGCEIVNAGLAKVLKHRVRVWVPQDSTRIILMPTCIHGAVSDPPVDLLRVGTHYQALDARRLKECGAGPDVEQGQLTLGQLSCAAVDRIEDALVESGVAIDTGGDGDCQFLSAAYAANWRGFRSVLNGDDDLHRIDLKRFSDRIADSLRAACITTWVDTLRSASYDHASECRSLIRHLEEAAHNEASEILGKAASKNPSVSWVINIERHPLSTLRQRRQEIEDVMRFCPLSDATLTARGKDLLDVFDRHIAASAKNDRSPRGWRS